MNSPQAHTASVPPRTRRPISSRLAGLLLPGLSIWGLLLATPTTWAQNENGSQADQRVATFELRWWAENAEDGVFDLARTQDGMLWAATGNGLLRLDGAETLRFMPGLDATTTTKLPTPPDGSIPLRRVRAVEPESTDALVVALDDGAYRFDGRRFVLLSRPGVGGRPWAAKSLLLDRDRVLWVAAADTLLRLAPDAFSLRQGLPGVAVSLLWEDPYGYLWATTESGHVFRRLGNAFQPVNFPLRMGTGRIQCLHLDADGHLWLLQADRGWKVDGDFAGAGLPRGAQPIESLDGMAIRTCRSAPEGGLWLGTERGLAFRADDGSQTFVPGFDAAVRTILPTADGSLWVGTERGLAQLYDPSTPPPLPSVLVTAAAVDGEDVALGDGFDLTSGVQELRLTLSAPSFRRPSDERIRYRWGESTTDATDWMELGGKQLLLDDLPAGESVLTLQAGLGDSWNEPGTEIRIHREPGLWQTRAFWGAVSAGVGAIMVWLLYLRWAGPGPSPLEIPEEIDDDIVHLEDLDTDELVVSQETVERARRNIFGDEATPRDQLEDET